MSHALIAAAAHSRCQCSALMRELVLCRISWFEKIMMIAPLKCNRRKKKISEKKIVVPMLACVRQHCATDTPGWFSLPPPCTMFFFVNEWHYHKETGKKGERAALVVVPAVLPDAHFTPPWAMTPHVFFITCFLHSVSLNFTTTTAFLVYRIKRKYSNRDNNDKKKKKSLNDSSQSALAYEDEQLQPACCSVQGTQRT